MYIRNCPCRILLAAACCVLTPCLAEQPAAPPTPADHHRPLNVAILVFDHVEPLDFMGPAEVFWAADNARAFHVYTVSASRDPVTVGNMMQVIPKYTIADCPKPDVLVIPGGAPGAVTANADLMKWIKQTAAVTRCTLSVCSGALVLAEAGLLDGLEVTSHHNVIGALRKAAPRATVVTGRRFVDNGKIVTSAGVSAGIDAALHVVAIFRGKQIADQTRDYLEYPQHVPASGGQ